MAADNIHTSVLFDLHVLLTDLVLAHVDISETAIKQVSLVYLFTKFAVQHHIGYYGTKLVKLSVGKIITSILLVFISRKAL